MTEIAENHKRKHDNSDLPRCSYCKAFLPRNVERVVCQNCQRANLNYKPRATGD